MTERPDSINIYQTLNKLPSREKISELNKSIGYQVYTAARLFSVNHPQSLIAPESIWTDLLRRFQSYPANDSILGDISSDFISAFRKFSQGGTFNIVTIANTTGTEGFEESTNIEFQTSGKHIHKKFMLFGFHKREDYRTVYGKLKFRYFLKVSQSDNLIHIPDEMDLIYGYVLTEIINSDYITKHPYPGSGLKIRQNLSSQS